MNKTVALERIIKGCQISLKIIAKYYCFKIEDNIEHFILPPNSHLQANCGQVIFDECLEANECYVGIQFGEQIVNEFENNHFVNLNSVAVVAEESSHFKLITDSIRFKTKISQLEIETLGEIDRFLCLLHWNEESHYPKLKCSWNNLHDVCDAVFLGDRFKESDQVSLYVEAENLAFMHLKNAFQKEWDSSYFDFARVHSQAKNYFTHLRSKILKAV